MTDELQNRLQAALGTGYQIERELGGAGMSRVFTARETALQRRVVIKVLPPDLAAGVNHERFRREIQLAAQLQHPHIVPLLTAGEAEGLLWFIMPFIEGESLRAAIARRGRFPVRDVIRVLHDVTDALAYAHARGVVHRDIKPGNILTSGMHSLVTDFGVAKALSAATPSMGVGTTTGMAIGTPAYMAPEQLAADPAADHRMDLYAVGLLGYELLTGKSPFGGTSPQATLAAQLTQTPDPPHRTMTDVPIGLSNVIMHCLEKDASKRPASAVALLAELDALPALGSGESPSRASGKSRRGPALLATVVLLVAIAFAIAQSGRFGRSGNDLANASSQGSGTSASGAGQQPGAAGGASGANANTMAAGKSGDSVQVVIKPETVIVRDTTYMRDGQQRQMLPIVISRAESIAIADAFRKRQSPAPPAAPAAPKAGVAADPKVYVGQTPVVALPPIARESLLVELRRVFSDSMARVFARVDSELKRMPRSGAVRPEPMLRNEMFSPLIAPPSDGKVRLVVQGFNNGTGRRDLGTLGRMFADSLRASISSNGTYSVVDAVLTTQAVRGSGNFVSVGWALRADFVVSGTYFIRGDSLVLLTQLNDVRGGRFTRVGESTAPVSDGLRAWPSSASLILAWLDTARTARDGRGRGGRDGRNMPANPGLLPRPTPP